MSGKANEQEVEYNDSRIVDDVQEPEYDPKVFETLDATDEEVTEQEEPEQSYQVPEKFRDKSMEDVIKSYQELEKGFGKQANELGELRKLADKFLSHQLDTQKVQAPVEPEPGIDLDQFVQNPDEVIKQAIRKELEPQQREFHEYAAQQEGFKRQHLIANKHPDIQNILSDPNFAEWVKVSPYRQRMLAEAHFQWDVDAADALFSEWKNVNKSAEEVQTQRIKRDLKNASAETSGSGKTDKPKYRRADLITLRINNPERFEEMQDEIQRAYAEHRVI